MASKFNSSKGESRATSFCFMLVYVCLYFETFAIGSASEDCCKRTDRSCTFALCGGVVHCEFPFIASRWIFFNSLYLSLVFLFASSFFFYCWWWCCWLATRTDTSSFVVCSMEKVKFLFLCSCRSWCDGGCPKSGMAGGLRAKKS